MNPYQTGYSDINKSLYDKDHRLVKSKKILAVLCDIHELQLATCRVLELGCSTGMNANFLAEYCGECIGIDIDEKALRYARDHAHPRVGFIYGDAMNIPFPDNCYDVVVCNHVYEHVPDSGQMMEEIFRILRPGGVCYFAAGNKYGLIEGHYHLPFLSWLPKSLAHIYLNLSGKGSYYYENHLSYPALCRLVRKFCVTDYTMKIIRDPARFRGEDMIRPGSVICRIPEFMLKRGQLFFPTYIFILRKPGG
jgi:ubiquinone/menaquinone biosynthesis C-methylase UbiE